LGEEEAAAVARRRRARGRQDGEGRARVKGAEGKRDERLAVAAAVAGGRRRSSIAGDGKGEEEAEPALLFSRMWLSLRDGD
jgi:hypothetical protein